MEKIARRVKRAERVSLKQRAKVQEQREAGERWDRNTSRQRMLREQNRLIKQARENRHHDWMAGPLAPRRDVGDLAKTYGSIPAFNFPLPYADPEYDPDPKYSKRPRWHPLREGDRVVILVGRDRGKIGTVNEVARPSRSVIVRDLNMIDVSLPDWMKKQQQTDRDIETHGQQIPYDHVRLVYPLPDPETKVPRDVIIDRLICANRKKDRVTEEWDDGIRLVPGSGKIIPWPAKADPEYEEHADDTPYDSVKEQTFQPVLIRSPMPLSVIDELRNKFSRFRTRHDYEYQAKRERESTQMEARKDLIKTMRTPRQELIELRSKQKEAQRKELTPQHLATIGAVIAQERARSASPAQGPQQ